MAKGLLLTIIEQRNSEIRDVSWEAIAAAKTFSSRYDLSMAVALCGCDCSDLASQAARYCPLLYYLESEQLKYFACDRYGAALQGLADKLQPNIIILPHSIQGMDLGASLGGRLGVPFLPDCLDLSRENGSWMGERSLFGGKVMGQFSSAQSNLVIASIRSGIFNADAEGHEEGKIVTNKIALDPTDFVSEVLELIPPAIGGIDITKFEIIVGVGRGIGDKEKVGLLDSLAVTLGGTLAATRPVVDMGWLPREQQVGQSGKTVKPKLYIACGISGASQHIMGMKGSQKIIAINTDPKAPIFNVADFGVVGDIFDVLPPMIEAIKAKQ